VLRGSFGRGFNNVVPITQFLSTPDSSGKPLSGARSLERIAGKGSKKEFKKKKEQTEVCSYS
jgi:hypothetical protein